MGVLYLYGNYGGDVLNFDLATDLAAAEGIRVETVLGADDVASAPKEKKLVDAESQASSSFTRSLELPQTQVSTSTELSQLRRKQPSTPEPWVLR